MTDKRPSSTKVRRECFDANRQTDPAGRIYLECHICKGLIWPGSDSWEAEHYVPFAIGGTKVLPAHTRCHKTKTGRDVSEIAKGKRIFDKQHGIVRQGRAIAGSRRSRWKKKMNGEVVER